GTYGQADTTQKRLIEDRPYWPAVLNTWDGAAWSARVFAGAGWVSSQARDASGAVWVALSRGGAARESIDPENWRFDRHLPGLMREDGGTWQGLGTAAGLPANDVTVVAVAPDGAVWVGTQGWGLGEYRPEAAAPTATATSAARPPAATATREATATGGVTATPSVTAPTPGGATATPTRAGTRPAGGATLYLPACRQGMW
ncbi:MAG: two-component regulator propeller domain-containing protein, partial [Anaerolineae bacterium]